MSFRQITVIGCGLIGGSFALAAKAGGFRGSIVGSDRAAVLAQAHARGAIDSANLDPIASVAGSDLVLLATPVGAILDLIERLAPAVAADALLTDVGSTKDQIVARARDRFGEQAPQRFLPGHPMAGKEHSGIEHADPALFRGAAWLLTPLSVEQLEQPRCRDFADLLSAIGARVVVTDLAQHDRLCAFLSHLPQLLSTALGATLADFLEEDSAGRGEITDASFIGGRALRETTRLAASPYSMWRDIAFTNTRNIEEALERLEQHLAHIRENLRTPELRAEFDRARQLFNAETQRRREKERSNKQ